MKTITFILYVFLTLQSCSAQDNIQRLIKTNLESRYVNVEIISFSKDSCPNMENLFNSSLSIRIISAQCESNIAKAILKFYQSVISFDEVKNICDKEIERMKKIQEQWSIDYNNNYEKCYLVKYRYGNSDGIKITKEEHFSLNIEKYEEGNYPNVIEHLNLDRYFAFNYYKEVSQKYLDFLWDVINDPDSLP